MQNIQALSLGEAIRGPSIIYSITVDTVNDPISDTVILLKFYTRFFPEPLLSLRSQLHPDWDTKRSAVFPLSHHTEYIQIRYHLSPVQTPCTSGIPTG